MTRGNLMWCRVVVVLDHSGKLNESVLEAVLV